jgi:hypothetical protein
MGGAAIAIGVGVQALAWFFPEKTRAAASGLKTVAVTASSVLEPAMPVVVPAIATAVAAAARSRVEESVGSTIIAEAVAQSVRSRIERDANRRRAERESVRERPAQSTSAAFCHACDVYTLGMPWAGLFISMYRRDDAPYQPEREWWQ